MTNAVGLSGNSWYPKLSCSYQNGNTYSQTALQQESGQSTVMIWFKFHSLKEEHIGICRIILCGGQSEEMKWTKKYGSV